MSDTRAAIRELRSLSEKRSTQGLTELERSRLAELRERLGLPSEPAEARTDGPTAGGTGAPGAQVAPVAPGSQVTAPAVPVAARSAPTVPPPPAGAAELPRLEAPEAGALPSLETGVPPPVALGPAMALPVPGTASPSQLPEALSDTATAPPIEVGWTSPEPEPPLEPEATTTLPDLEAQGPGPDLEVATAEVEESAAQPVLEVLETAAVPPDAPLPPEEEAAAAWAGVQAAAEGTGALDFLPPPEPETPPVPGELAPEARRPSLAERINAMVEAGEVDAPATAEALAWAEAPVAPGPLAPEELGAIPLDVADPAAEFGVPAEGAPIELSSADVVLLEGESTPEMDLGGEPADPVPLAGLHEFIGEQPEDPRALAFDDQGGEQPTFAPEQLQATEAELAGQPGDFHAPPAEEPAPPPPAPPAPRFVLPRPPPGPPPARPAVAAAPTPEPRAAPVSPRSKAPGPAPARAAPPPAPAAPSPDAGASPARRSGEVPDAAGPARTRVPPPPPAAAYVLADDGRRMPAFAAAVPEPPQLAHQFGRSGPFGRPQALLLTPAPLDMMDDGDALPPEPEPEPEPEPATDVATGGEVFGEAYLSPTFVEGEHRVVLHTLEGQVRRGTVKDLDLLDPVIRLAQPGRPPEGIAAERVKAIFFMQEPGTAPLPSAGRRIRVGFADGRQIVGFSEDVDASEQGFFLVPADTRTHTARIYVFRAGVQSINAA
ncbi:MAG TPA: hypothetical protein VMT11_10765 [Myxococcaceae bacterium]|nr:hypothetical protein [Myxococcaceae bacterium]